MKIKYFLPLPFLALICFILLQSCNNRRPFIDITKIVIPDSLYIFFPNKDTLFLKYYSMGTNAELSDRIGEKSTFIEAYFYKIYSCENPTQFDLLIHDYQQKSIDAINPTDDNYFIMKYEPDMLKMYNSDTLKIIYQKSIDKYILPSFHDETRNLYGLNYNISTVCGLPEDYKILVMKSGRNYVLPENNTWKFEWKILPKELQHGYTSGIAYRTYKNKIIFWCIAW